MIYAYQVAPEMQESPFSKLSGEEFPDGIIVLPTTLHPARCQSKYRKILKICLRYYSQWTIYGQVQKYDLMRVDGKPWSKADLRMWEKTLNQHPNMKIDLAAVLKILTGAEWKQALIHNISINEWRVVYYRSDLWSDDQLNEFEIKYFNLGSAWSIGTEDGPVEGAAISYLTTKDYVTVRKQIAERLCVAPCEVVLFAHDGYIRHDKYKLIK